jgi:hypothetical protein
LFLQGALDKVLYSVPQLVQQRVLALGLNTSTLAKVAEMFTGLMSSLSTRTPAGTKPVPTSSVEAMQEAVQQALASCSSDSNAGVGSSSSGSGSSSSSSSSDTQCCLNKLALLLLGYGRPAGLVAAAQGCLGVPQTGVPLPVCCDAQLRQSALLPEARFSRAGGFDVLLGNTYFYGVHDYQQAATHYRWVLTAETLACMASSTLGCMYTSQARQGTGTQAMDITDKGKLGIGQLAHSWPVPHTCCSC